MERFEKALRAAFGERPFTAQDVMVEIDPEDMPEHVATAVLCGRQRGAPSVIGKFMIKAGLAVRTGAKERRSARVLWQMRSET